MNLSHLPIIAKDAIRKGILAKDAVVRMELIGLKLKTVNDLEKSEYNIVFLHELLERDDKELLGIVNISKISLKQIYDTLARYHELDKIENDKFNLGIS